MRITEESIGITHEQPRDSVMQSPAPPPTIEPIELPVFQILAGRGVTLAYTDNLPLALRQSTKRGDEFSDAVGCIAPQLDYRFAGRSHHTPFPDRPFSP